MRRLPWLVLLAGVVWGVWYVFLSPVPIDPAAWRPPLGPRLTGAYRPNGRLAAIERLGSGMGRGPEDVAVDARGRIYAGVDGGRIIRMASDGSGAETFATTGGRPLGLDFDGSGNLIVADADRGLLSVTSDGQVRVLATGQGDRPFRLTNDVDVARDGTIYFSDSSWKFPLSEYMADLMEHRPNGRLLAYDPSTGETRIVLDEIYFANGVAVSDDGRFVLVAEMGEYRIRRVWLTGDRAGSDDIFVENLPGFPDGISADGSGRFWLTLAAPRDPYVDTQLLPSPFLRKVIWRMPESFLPQIRNYGFVMRLDGRGRVGDVLQDPRGRYAPITSVEQVGRRLYFGSNVQDAVGRLTAP